MADGGGDAGGDAVGPRAGDPLRQHREEEVGGQLCLHGALRLRRRVALLGDLGLQHVLRRQAPPSVGQGQAGARPEVPHQTDGAAGHRPLLQERQLGDGHDYPLLPHGFHGLLPVRLRRHHTHPPRRLPPRPHEHHRLDALRPPLAHLLLHRRRLLPLGRRLPLPVGRHRLLRRLRHPPLLRHRRLHLRLLGWAEVDEGQGEISPQQRAADARRSRTPVDGVGRVQRRRSLLGQHRLVDGGAQHQHLRRHQPPRLDLPRRHLLQETVGDRRGAGHDHRPRLHHSRRRAGARLGGDSDGDIIRQHPLVHHDGHPQALPHPAASRRHPRRLPHPRRRRPARRRHHRSVRGAHPLLPLPPRHQLPRRRLPRRRRGPVPQAARRRLLHYRLEPRRHHHHLPRHQPPRPAAHAGGAAPHRRRRRARRRGLRLVGRRRAVRLHAPRLVRRRHDAPQPAPAGHRRHAERLMIKSLLIDQSMQWKNQRCV